MSSVSILHSDYLHLRLNVIVSSTFSIECLWLLVSISVFTVGDFFSNKEIHTFSHICANQSASETFNTRLWRRNTKPASDNYLAIVVLTTNRTCGAFPWQVYIFSCVVAHHVLKMSFHHNVKKLFLPSVKVSDIFSFSENVRQLIYCVFRWYFLTFFCCCTGGWTRSILIVTSI